MEMGGGTNGGGTEHSGGAGRNLSMGGRDPHVRGAPPPTPICMQIKHTNQGPMQEWELAPPTPLRTTTTRMGHTQTQKWCPPPFFCAPCPLQRGRANQGMRKPRGAPPPLGPCTRVTHERGPHRNR